MKKLIFDLETAPAEAHIWSCWQDKVPYNMVNREGYILMWAAKWHGEKKIHYSTRNEGERECLAKLWELVDEADVLIAHNGDRFDVRVMNAFFINQGFPPPSPYRTVDTLKAAKREFKFMSNRLDDLGGLFEVGHKVQHGGFDLWRGCMDGDRKSWKTMIKYNKQDVILLEKVYEKLLPWMKNHPSHGPFVEGCVCKNCGGSSLHRRGFNYSNAGKFQRYQCLDCHSWSSDRGNLIKPKNTLK